MKFVPRQQRGTEQPEKGTKLASAVLYNNPTWYHRISDLQPLPLNYATKNDDAIAEAMDRLLPADCEALGEALTHLPARIKPRLYEVPIKETSPEDSSTI